MSNRKVRYIILSFLKIFRFIFNRFSQQKLATFGFEDYFQCVQLNDGSIINLRIMDTAGQEQFFSINDKYYKIAECCLLVYDITKKDSFDKIIEDYIPKIKEKCYKDIKVILLGNKADLKEEREVEDKEGSKLAEENGYIFMESSCKDNYNVSDAFTALVEITNNDFKRSNTISRSHSRSLLSIKETPQVKKKTCCKK